MLDEKAKAIQEVAKTTHKALDFSEKIGDFLKTILGDTLNDVGAILTDWANYLRYKNLLCIQDKVNDIHKKRMLEGKTIPIMPRYAIPLLQNASIENEETIQDLWAALIANATDPEKRFQVKKIYIKILSEIEPLDTLVLKFFMKQEIKDINVVDGSQEGFNLEQLLNDLDVRKEELKASLNNLHQLGCIIAQAPFILGSATLSARFDYTVSCPDASFSLTSLGYSFLKACES